MRLSIDPKRALRFVVIIGIVNLFADFTYEGGRGVVGAFLGQLGASGAAVGAIAGGGELAGYAIRSVSGVIADRTGFYWLDVWVGYAINVLCVPALALAGSWPAAAGLLIGERIGRGIRKPVTSAMLSEAGRSLGSGRVFGINEALDQTGATLGPLAVAFALARGGFHLGFGMLIVPALLTLAFLLVATAAGQSIVPRDEGRAEPAVARLAGISSICDRRSARRGGLRRFCIDRISFCARSHRERSRDLDLVCGCDGGRRGRGAALGAPFRSRG